MCKWYCLSNGSSTELICLHCGTNYCGACLHGDAGVMKSLVQCAKCGKIPGQLSSKEKVEVQQADSLARRGSRGSPILSTKRATLTKKIEELSISKQSVDSDGLEKLDMIFSYYCHYAPASSSLDNVKFFKAIKEMGLIDGTKVTRAEVDLIFTRVKGKGERKLLFDQFVKGIEEVAAKKYPMERDSLLKLMNNDLAAFNDPSDLDGRNSGVFSELKEKKAPVETRRSTKKEAEDLLPFEPVKRETAKRSSGQGSIFDRLTDTSLYTGTHKNRFDANGRGIGMQGRDSIAKQGVGKYHGGDVHDLSQITRPNLQ